MLQHLADRPLTMIRFPEGLEGERFFQKHWSGTPGFVRTVPYFRRATTTPDYLVCDNATLLWVAQAGTLEFHVWHSRTRPGPDAAQRGTDFSTPAALQRSVLNHPDYVVFDIDPYIYSGKEAAGAEPELNTAAFEKGREVAFWLRELLQEMRLEPIVKTSGKTGLHVFVPIARTIDFAVAREVSERVGRHLPRSPARHHDGMEREKAHREDFHGLQHECAREDAQCGVLAAGAARRAGLDAGHLGGAGACAPARLPAHGRAGTARAHRRPLEERAHGQARPRAGAAGAARDRTLRSIPWLPDRLAR
jgi:hypothetical protein